MRDFEEIFTDLDQRASGSIVVDSYDDLNENQAVGTIEILDYTELGGKKITVDSVVYEEGVDFTAETSNDVTATNLATAIDTDAQGACATGAIVTVTATTAGTSGNAIDMSTDDAVNISLSGALLTGGRDYATITVDTDVLTAGTDFIAGTSNDATATAIASAINALTGITSSATTNIVNVYVTASGTSGNGTALTYTGLGMTFSASELSGGVNETYSEIFDYSSEANPEELEERIACTALDGTNPTVDVTPQYSLNKIDFDDTTAFTQLTAVGKQTLERTLTGLFTRYKIELGGADTVATLKITTIEK